MNSCCCSNKKTFQNLSVLEGQNFLPHINILATASQLLWLHMLPAEGRAPLWGMTFLQQKAKGNAF